MAQTVTYKFSSIALKYIYSANGTWKDGASYIYSSDNGGNVVRQLAYSSYTSNYYTGFWRYAAGSDGVSLESKYASYYPTGVSIKLKRASGNGAASSVRTGYFGTSKSTNMGSVTKRQNVSVNGTGSGYVTYGLDTSFIDGYCSGGTAGYFTIGFGVNPSSNSSPAAVSDYMGILADDANNDLLLTVTWESRNTAPYFDSSARVSFATVSDSYRAPYVKSGGQISCSWPAAGDAQGNITTYQLKRSVYLNGAWNESIIYSGPNRSYTDTISASWPATTNIAYIVTAIDSGGLSGGMADWAYIYVNHIPSAPSSIAVAGAVSGRYAANAAHAVTIGTATDNGYSPNQATALLYLIQVFDSNNAVVASSGWINGTSYTIPANTLQTNKRYTVKSWANDGWVSGAEKSMTIDTNLSTAEITAGCDVNIASASILKSRTVGGQVYNYDGNILWGDTTLNINIPGTIYSATYTFTLYIKRTTDAAYSQLTSFTVASSTTASVVTKSVNFHTLGIGYGEQFTIQFAVSDAVFSTTAADIDALTYTYGVALNAQNPAKIQLTNDIGSSFIDSSINGSIFEDNISFEIYFIPGTYNIPITSAEVVVSGTTLSLQTPIVVDVLGVYQTKFTCTISRTLMQSIARGVAVPIKITGYAPDGGGTTNSITVSPVRNQAIKTPTTSSLTIGNGSIVRPWVESRDFRILCDWGTTDFDPDQEDVSGIQYKIEVIGTNASGGSNLNFILKDGTNDWRQFVNTYETNNNYGMDVTLTNFKSVSGANPDIFQYVNTNQNYNNCQLKVTFKDIFGITTTVTLPQLFTLKFQEAPYPTVGEKIQVAGGKLIDGDYCFSNGDIITLDWADFNDYNGISDFDTSQYIVTIKQDGVTTITQSVDKTVRHLEVPLSSGNDVILTIEVAITDKTGLTGILNINNQETETTKIRLHRFVNPSFDVVELTRDVDEVDENIAVFGGSLNISDYGATIIGDKHNLSNIQIDFQYSLTSSFSGTVNTITLKNDIPSVFTDAELLDFSFALNKDQVIYARLVITTTNINGDIQTANVTRSLTSSVFVLSNTPPTVALRTGRIGVNVSKPEIRLAAVSIGMATTDVDYIHFISGKNDAVNQIVEGIKFFNYYGADAGSISLRYMLATAGVQTQESYFYFDRAIALPSMVDGNLLSADVDGKIVNSGIAVSKLWTTDNFDPADVTVDLSGYALVDHTHNYLPLDGGNLTGNLTISGRQVVYARKTRYNTADSTSINNAGNEVGFDYNTAGSGVTGPFLSVGSLNAGDGYLLQIVAGYNNPTNIQYRTRNGDNQTWNSWYSLWHSGNLPNPATMTQANGYWGINTPDGQWLRISNGNGIIPYQSGGAASIGTSSWPFAAIYGNTVYQSGSRVWSAADFYLQSS